MFFIMKNRMAMYEISIKIVVGFCMFYNRILRTLCRRNDSLACLSLRMASGFENDVSLNAIASGFLPKIRMIF